MDALGMIGHTEKTGGTTTHEKMVMADDGDAADNGDPPGAVSYTHLDVYKRQHTFSSGEHEEESAWGSGKNVWYCGCLLYTSAGKKVLDRFHGWVPPFLESILEKRIAR